MPRWRRGAPRARSERTPAKDNQESSEEMDTPPPKISRRNHNDLCAARGRFKGALMDAIEYNAEDSDSSLDRTITKRSRTRIDKLVVKNDTKDLSTDEEDSSSERNKKNRKKFSKLPRNNSYVMKLHDRSVDLAQFTENTPLYPICRSWMANSPRSGTRVQDDKEATKEEPCIENGIKLPPPEGPPVSRLPPLLREQRTRSKHNINLNYSDEPPVPKETLLRNHLTRWNAIRRKWLQQSILYEMRYASTQEMLTEMDTNS